MDPSNTIVPQPRACGKGAPPSSTTPRRNADGFIDTLLSNGPAPTRADAVCAGLLLPTEPVYLDGGLLNIGPRALEFPTEAAADNAAVAVRTARKLAGIPEPGQCSAALPDAETPFEGEKGGLAPAVDHGAPITPEDLAAITRKLRPERVVIDLSANRVDLVIHGVPCIFLFPSLSLAFFAGLAAEVARRESECVSLTPAGVRALGVG